MVCKGFLEIFPPIFFHPFYKTPDPVYNPQHDRVSAGDLP